MSIPTDTGIGTALSGLEAMQAGLDTTSENISNASTPGYARQVVNLVDNNELTLWGTGIGAGIELGTGVQVQSITRDDDFFTDQQYWTQNGATTNSSTIAAQLSDLQSDLDDTSTTGISTQLGNFFSGFEALSENTSSNSATAAAQEIVSQGQTLAQMFNSVSSEMSTLQTQAGQQLTALTDPTSGEVQQYANQIAQLNAQISSLGQSGTAANTLMDQRAQAVNSLSALVSISVTQTSTGAYTVSLANSSAPGASTPLVDGTKGDQSGAVTLPTSYTAADGGQVGALASLASSSGPIGQLSTALDTVANQVISDVNGLMPSSTPIFTGNSASTIAVSSAATPAALVALASNQSVTPSNGGATTTGADLLGQIYSQADNATDSYASFVDQVGNSVDQAQDAATTGQSLLTSISNQQQSISGVSLDEEMTNLITFQQGYEASARAMNTMQTVIQSLISAVGGAGV